MPASLTVTPVPGPDGTLVLKATGEIDLSNAAVLAEEIQRHPGRLVVDLGEVGYLDSAGLSVLFAHADRIELVVPEQLAPVVAISGIADVTTVRPSG